MLPLCFCFFSCQLDAGALTRRALRQIVCDHNSLNCNCIFRFRRNHTTRINVAAVRNVCATPLFVALIRVAMARRFLRILPFSHLGGDRLSKVNRYRTVLRNRDNRVFLARFLGLHHLCEMSGAGLRGEEFAK